MRAPDLILREIEPSLEKRFDPSDRSLLEGRGTIIHIEEGKMARIRRKAAAYGMPQREFELHRSMLTLNPAPASPSNTVILLELFGIEHGMIKMTADLGRSDPEGGIGFCGFSLTYFPARDEPKISPIEVATKGVIRPGDKFGLVIQAFTSDGFKIQQSSDRLMQSRANVMMRIADSGDSEFSGRLLYDLANIYERGLEAVTK